MSPSPGGRAPARVNPDTTAHGPTATIPRMSPSTTPASAAGLRLRDRSRPSTLRRFRDYDGRVHYVPATRTDGSGFLTTHASCGRSLPAAVELPVPVVSPMNEVCRACSEELAARSALRLA